MNVTVQVLGRTAIDQPFAVLSTVAVVLGGAPLALTPAVPAGAAGQELRVRVAPEANMQFAVGPWLDPANRPGPSPLYDGNGALIGQSPAPTPQVRTCYAAWGGAQREAPFFVHDSLILGPADASLLPA